METVYRLTVQQLTGKWRLIVMTVLAAMPVLFTMLVTNSESTPTATEFDLIVLGGMLAGSIAPLIMVAIASVAFGNEVDDRTLANLTLSPIPRWQIVVPKLAAAITVAGPFIAASAFLTSYIGFNRDWTATLAVTGSAVIGLTMYASAFVWLGLVTRQAIGIGLSYIVLWEGFFSGYVSGIRFLSIRHYAAALMHGMDPRRFVESSHVGLGPALAVAVGVIVLFTVLTTRRLQGMDVP
jgi:ABC-2 type transport system permease protein